MIQDNRKTGRGGGGVALYIHRKFKNKIRKDVHTKGIQNLLIEIDNTFGGNVIIGTLHRLIDKKNLWTYKVKRISCIFKQLIQNHHVIIMTENVPLDQKEYVKVWGFTIDKHLIWNQNQHVIIATSIAKGVGILYKVKDYLLEHSLLMIYNTLILPYIYKTFAL